MENPKWFLKLDISNHCNLRCPHCARNFIKNDYKLNSRYVSLEKIKRWIPKSFVILNTSKTVLFSGALAEPTLNSELIEIVEYFLKFKCKISIDSNGSTNNEDWWYKLGKTKVKCYFSPDSLVPNNNQYRINSNTEKVISNMKAFISGGGIASWKYLPFKHNEDEYDAQKTLAKKIGAEFGVVQPSWFDANAEGETMVPSKYFPNSKKIVNSNLTNNPEDYCVLIGKAGSIIEVTPDGVIYPCCFAAKPFFSVYAPFFNNEETKPLIREDLMKSSTKYKYFVEDILPLIETQGGIKTLSLNFYTITDILNTDLFKRSLKSSWESGNNFCTKECRSRDHILYKI
jgi:organic radical activating enzyme